MKRKFPPQFFVFTLIIVAIFLFFNSHEVIKKGKRIGSEQYYVKIADASLVDNRYTYALEGYSSENKTKLLIFDSDRILRSDAYLRVYVRDEDRVISWEEVQLQDIPLDLRKKIN